MTIQKSKVAQRFSLSAYRYDQIATIQNKIGDQLVARIPENLTGRLIDLGCGTGRLLKQLETSGRFALTGIDLAPGMLEAAKKVTAAELFLRDVESTQFADDHFDIAISNAVFQWCDLPTAIEETSRIIKPGGHFFLTLFGPQTLNGWRTALANVGSEKEPHVHSFVEQNRLLQLLADFQFDPIDLAVEMLEQSFSSARAMLNSVRRLGASYAGEQITKFSKTRYNQFLAQLESNRHQDGDFRLTYETYFVSCRLAS